MPTLTLICYLAGVVITSAVVIQILRRGNEDWSRIEEAFFGAAAGFFWPILLVVGLVYLLSTRLLEKVMPRDAS